MEIFGIRGLGQGPSFANQLGSFLGKRYDDRRRGVAHPSMPHRAN